MSELNHIWSLPNESEEYRQARNELLVAELELIEQIEAVAKMRRALPQGGELKEDYVFEEGSADLRDTTTVHEVRLSELFSEGKDTLILINMMYSPDNELPCSSCNSLADGYNATAPHVSDQVNFALVARAPIRKLRSWAASRNWNDLRLLSSFNNTFNTDYHTETEEHGQIPAITVFHKGEDGVIRHFYSVEMHLNNELDRDPRQLDFFWPLWHLLDLTPNGRHPTWYPGFSYRDEAMK